MCRWVIVLLAAYAIGMLLGCATVEDDPPLQVAIDIVQLHGPDGEVVDIVPGCCILRGPKEIRGELLPKSVHCVVLMSGNRQQGVREDCETVRRLLEHNP